MTQKASKVQLVDPNDAFDDVLHWIWSWRLQIRRLNESFRVEWSDPKDLDRRKAFSHFSYDEHILSVTGWNLVRAVRHAEAYLPANPLPPRQSEALRLLRHLYEHWDEQRAAFKTDKVQKDRSAAAFVAQFPEGRPWTMVFDKDDWLLGGVVRLNEITETLQTLETLVLASEVERKGRV